MSDLLSVVQGDVEAKFVTFPDSPFQLCQIFEPAGDQPAAIAQLVEGINDGLFFHKCRAKSHLESDNTAFGSSLFLSIGSHSNNWLYFKC